MRFLLLVAALAACGPQVRPASPQAPEPPDPDGWANPAKDYPQARPALVRTRPTPPPVLIRGATVLTATGKTIKDGTVVVENGKITVITEGGAKAPTNAVVIDAKGRYLTPGIIDSHSHIGVYAAPFVDALSDGNEMVAPTTPKADAAYGYYPQDPAITRALAGGVTSAMILPGSANLIGGKGFIVEMRTGVEAADVAFPGAPRTLKMACGENPKRTYGEKGGPQTRMAMYAAFREAFQLAAEYRMHAREYERLLRQWQRKQTLKKPDGKPMDPEAAPTPPVRDANLEVLGQVLDGKILVHVHCYRADEILQMVRIADEFGFSIRSFHHALEAYKVRDVLAAKGIAISTWADWWGFKLEAWDGIPENAGLFAEAGGRAIIHSDSSIGIQRLNQEAAKALASARAAGIKLDENDALRWITANPAWALGIDHLTGTIEVGKRGDLVLWNAHPLSVYALPDVVLIGGDVAYERGGRQPTDFEIGQETRP
jgi:imidazolonepropionase-like amidohydrolase